MPLNDQYHPGGVSCEERLGPFMGIAEDRAKMYLRMAASSSDKFDICPRCRITQVFCAMFEVALENRELDKEAVFDMAMNGLAKMTQRIAEKEEAARAAVVVP